MDPRDRLQEETAGSLWVGPIAVLSFTFPAASPSRKPTLSEWGWGGEPHLALPMLGRGNTSLEEGFFHSSQEQELLGFKGGLHPLFS